MREHPVRNEDLDHLGPVMIAALIEVGWFREWPWTVTTGGWRAAQSGAFSRDKFPNVELQGELTRREGGAYHWEGRAS